MVFEPNSKFHSPQKDVYTKKMLESRPEDALVKLVKTVEFVETAMNLFQETKIFQIVTE